MAKKTLMVNGKGDIDGKWQRRYRKAKEISNANSKGDVDGDGDIWKRGGIIAAINIREKIWLLPTFIF